MEFSGLRLIGASGRGNVVFNKRGHVGPMFGPYRFIVFIFGMANSLCYMSSGMRLSMWNSCDHVGAMAANIITITLNMHP